MDKCKSCDGEFGYWRVWRSFWVPATWWNLSSNRFDCPSCRQRCESTPWTVLVSVLILALIDIGLMGIWMSLDFGLEPGTEELVDVFLLSLVPAVILVSFLFPLFARFKEREEKGLGGG